jgi:hypothetical protein
MVAGADGTAWVRISARDAKGKVVWHVWGGNGVMVGRALLDDNVFPLAVSETLLIARSESADGFQDVVRYRLR